MPTKTLRTFTVVLAVIGCSWSAWATQDPDNYEAMMEIGENLGKQLAAVAQSFVEARKAGANVTSDIQAARKAFWAQYPNGPNRKAAETAFARKLFLKDFLLAFVYMDGACATGPNAAAQGKAVLMRAMNAEVDGGIPARAMEYFCTWVEDLRKMGIGFTAAAEWMAIGPTLESYERYRKQRDWEEFAAAGKVPYASHGQLWESKHPYWHSLGMLMVRRDTTALPFPERLRLAAEMFDGLAKERGRDTLLNASRKLIAAPKGPNGGLKDLQTAKSLGCTNSNVDWCYWQLIETPKSRAAADAYAAKAAAETAALKAKMGPPTLEEKQRWAPLGESTDPRTYALYLSWFNVQSMFTESTPDQRKDWAEKNLAAWIKQYGEDKVLTAARLVRGAPKDANGELTYEAASSVGCGHCAAGVSLRAKGLGGGPCGVSSCVIELFARALQPTERQKARQALGIERPTPPAPATAASTATAIAGAPRKVKHVDAILPPDAAAQGVQGVVMVEITIGTDGRVTNARVLRSIPLLDQAALDAVRQWEYDATGLRAPVVTRATVTFARSPR